MEVTSESLREGPVLIKASGRLDAATVAVFEQTLQQLLDEEQYRLIVNLNNVNYISSSGLRALITARRRAIGQGGEIFLCCMSPRVRQVFDMIGFSSVFSVYEDVEQALQAFAPKES